MFDDFSLEKDYFAALMRADVRIAQAIAQEGCPLCGGPLHSANYLRKPRGGMLADAGEEFRLRLGLCCGRRGCRRRVLPPSLRFLGRKVYLEAVVLFAGAWAQVAGAFRKVRERTGISVRTLGRWLHWWQEQLPRLGPWEELRARFVPPAPEESELPRSLLVHLGRVVKGPEEVARLAARCLAPVTTSLPNAARFVRDEAIFQFAE
jgi:hypothetical protein